MYYYKKTIKKGVDTMKCKFPNLKCVSRSGTECKLNICALDNVGTEVILHKQIKKPKKIRLDFLGEGKKDVNND